MKMGLREANQNFSKAIKTVKNGGVVILTERGKPIATIQPIGAPSSEDAAVQQLIQEGVLRPAEEPGPIRDDWTALKIKGVSLSQTLRKLRDEE